MRPAGRSANQVRPVTLTRNYTKHAEGSVLVEFGDTKVLCTASIEEGVPRFLKGQGQGWITAEYGMLPRATHTRNAREAAKGKQGGRTMEIQRLIARALRAAVDLKTLGEFTITLDCDVIQADGGTRTASITGACVALADALNKLVASGKLKTNPMKGMVAAVSVGIVNGEALCDLEYVEDSAAETDMNVVMTEDGRIIEVQGTAEGEPFSHEELLTLLALARGGIESIVATQKAALRELILRRPMSRLFLSVDFVNDESEMRSESMKPYQRQFIEFALNKQVLKFGEFTLKSGRKSPYFFNAGLFNTGRDLALLGRFYAEALVDSGIEFDLLFGPAYKGIPIATTTAVALAEHHDKDLPYCFNRKEAKDHGEGGNLVGSALQGRVMLVDDVITAGTAIRESMEIIQANGATLAGVLISLDRQERGRGEISAIQEVERDYGCKVISIITLKDLIAYLEEKPEMAEHLAAVRAYREAFGV